MYVYVASCFYCLLKSQLLPSSSHPGLGLYIYGSNPVLPPPPAHMGITPLSFDLKTGTNLTILKNYF